MKTYTLNNGTKLPEVGFGTWQLTPDEALSSVEYAIDCGYRLIDTAAIYRNEEAVGEAIKNSKVAREDLIVTTKLWNKAQGYDNALTAFDKSMNKLGLSYLDIYLIHWPVDNNVHPEGTWKEFIKDTWKAFEKLVDDGSIKSIGVCNFMFDQLDYLLSIANIPPVLDQIELHPGHPQTATLEFAKKHNIHIEAWSPLGSGKLLNNPTLEDMAKKHNTTVANICLAYCQDKGATILPRSRNNDRIKSNLNTNRFATPLSSDEIKFLDNMNDDGYSGFDPYGLIYQ